MITCSVCAWREHCKKKYYIKDPKRCVDFTKDITLKTKSSSNDTGRSRSEDIGSEDIGSKNDKI